MLSGVGDLYAETLNLAGDEIDQRIIELYAFDFAFNSESTPREARGFVKGVKKIKSSAVGEVTDTLVISTQYTDWAQLGFALDEFPKSESSVKLPVLKQATVPTSAPYEIADAAITSANDNYIKAYVSAFGTWGQPGYMPRAATPATPAAGEVGVDTTGNKLVFNAEQAGAPVSYSIGTDYTSIEAYGSAGNSTKYGKIAMRGRLYTPESTNNWYIYFPSLSRQSRPSINLGDDVPSLEITFAAETPPGWEQPFAIYNLDTGVAA